MRRSFVLLGFFLFLAVFVLPLGTSRVTYYGDSVRDSYGGGERMNGIINLSFNDTNLDTLVRTNFANTSITLRDFLTASGFISENNYRCSTANCLPGYERHELVDRVDIVDGSALLGFSLQGTSVRDVQDARVTFESSADPTCALSLGADVLNSGQYLVVSDNYTSDSCYEPHRGCFESSGVDYSTLTLDAGTEYCERMTLPLGPAFMLGTTVTNTTQGAGGIKMRLRALEGTLLSECILPALNQSVDQVECLVPYSAAVQKEYFVCVVPTGAGSNYKIRAETHQPCGTPNFGESYPGDYEVYATNLRFGRPTISLAGSLFSNQTGAHLDEAVENYVTSTYGGSCSPFCIVPFRLFGTDQSIVIRDAYLRYGNALGGSTEATSFYRIESSAVTIDSGTLALDLDKTNFTFPLGAQAQYLDVFVGNERVLHKPINLSESFDFQLTPLFVAFGSDVVFNAVTPESISSSRWTFGDGTQTQTAPGKNITHRYLQEGTFTVNVELTRADGLVSRRGFIIAVGNARVTANATLAQARQSFNDITATLKQYPTWIQDDIEQQLGFSELNNSLRELELQYSFALNDSDYARIVTQLFSTPLPVRIRAQSQGEVPLLIGADAIDTTPLQLLSGSDVSDSDALRQAIVAWMTQHTAAQISFESIVVDFPSTTQPVLTHFTIQPKPRGTFDSEVNLFLAYDSKDIHFGGNYNPHGLEGATTIPITSTTSSIEFSVLDAVEPTELGAYISPAVSELGDFSAPAEVQCNQDSICDADETHALCPSDCRPWGTIVLIIGLIVAGGIAAFIGIMWWYRTRYESSLFPNKRDLVNIMAFISASKRNGMDDKDIKAKLKKTGWTGEQISYALKKYSSGLSRMSGTTTGDARFIKRPDFRTP